MNKKQQNARRQIEFKARMKKKGYIRKEFWVRSEYLGLVESYVMYLEKYYINLNVECEK